MMFGIVLCLVTVPLWLVVLFSDNFSFIIPAGFLLLATALSWVGSAAADLAEIAGIDLRGLGIAIFYFSVNIASYLIGSNLIRILSDRFGSTVDPSMMRYALLACPAACLAGAIRLWFGSRRVKEIT